MRILLTHSYCLRHDPKQRQKMRPYPPLALLYAASVLREAGYSVEFYDSTFAESIDEFADCVSRTAPHLVVLFEDSFNFVIKMCLGNMRQTALAMARIAGEHAATVVAAGPDVTDHPGVYLAGGVQYALVGEAEFALLDLLESLTGRSTTPVDRIDGVCTVGQAFRATRRSPERNADRFPLPAWDLVDFDGYRSAWIQAHGYFSLNMVTSRGCPYRCNWCAKPIWGNRYAVRSAASVAEEMALLKRVANPDHIWFADDIFGIRPAWVEELAHEVETRSASIPFMIQTRVDRMTEPAIDALKRAGCVEVWMGAESGSQPILDAMDKGSESADVLPACTRLKATGIKVGLFLQLGYPGETMADIVATVQMVRDCLPDQIGVSVSYPLPGTPFYDRVRRSIGAKTQWSDSGDLAMMYSGPYSSPFYRKLHGLIHKDLEVRQRVAASNGEPAAIIAEIDALNTEWFELGQMEPSHRSVRATELVVVRERHRQPAQNGAREGSLV